jgi:hypothetical protein
MPPSPKRLCLGSIIFNLSKPHVTLNGGCVLAVADEFPPSLDTDWKRTVSYGKGLGAGIFGQSVLATCGLHLGPEVDAEYQKTTTQMFAFDVMTTTGFEPTQEYVEEAVKRPLVRDWLARKEKERSGCKKLIPLKLELFMVTGMKVGKRSKMAWSTSPSTSIHGQIGIDVPALGMTCGPKGHWDSTKAEVTETNHEEEFVFAFRVNKLTFRPGKPVKQDSFTKGSFMSFGGKKDARDQDNTCVSIEDVDPADFEDSKLIRDFTENGNVYYCVCDPSQENDATAAP